MDQKSYEMKIRKIRQRENREMASDPLNWFYLAGLFWLEEGDNSFGSDEKNKIHLAAFPKPQCGALVLKNGTITLEPAKDIHITCNGRTPTSRPLRSDRDKKPDILKIGTLTLKIIKRGEAYLLRVWDKESPDGKNFAGLKYYPVRPEYCITAKFVNYRPPRPISIMTVLGTEQEKHLLGQAQFTWNGVECTLEAQDDGKNLLFSFNDKTKADATYGGGRYITTPKPKDGRVVLDFNLATNWPCAYTPFATCPMPPTENHLPVRIEAGELRYH